MDIRTAFAILGLAEGATPLQVRAAYRDLVKVWHPDRFVHDPPLQAKAAEQLRQINAAFDLLEERRTTDVPPPPSQTQPAPPPPPSQPPPPVEKFSAAVRVLRFAHSYKPLHYIAGAIGAAMIVSTCGTLWNYLSPPDLTDLLEPAVVLLDPSRPAGGGLDRTYVEQPLASDSASSPMSSSWYETSVPGLANSVEGAWLLNGKRFTFHQGMIRAGGESAALGYYDPNTPRSLYFRKAQNVHHVVVEVVFTPATMRWVVRDAGRRLVYEFVRAG